MVSKMPPSMREAKAAGLTRFFTGKPCKLGHISERLASSGNCVACRRTDEANARRRSKRNSASEGDPLKAAARRKKWELANPEKSRASSRRWYEANKEQHKAAVYRWREENPLSHTITRHKRRALELNAEGSHTSKDIEDILASQRGRCAYCRVKLNGKFHVDHIVSLSRGGSNAPANLQITCPRCNCRKNSKCPIEFAQSLGLLL